MRCQWLRLACTKRSVLLPLALAILTFVAIAFQRYVDGMANVYSTENRGGYTGSIDDQWKEDRRLALVALDEARVLATERAEKLTNIRPDESTEQHIERLIELLVNYEVGPFEQAIPLPDPSSQRITTKALASVQRCCRAQSAFDKLTAYKAAAIPLMLTHLHDQRMSFPLHNHCFNETVGEWCNWNIRLQLKDLPQDYSSYPAARLGRDGQEHDRSSWGIATLDDQERRGVLSHNGLKNWLEANKSLTYPQMQIKCLTWLLEKEKAIGAPDAESYFINILPLEIQILKRRIECGEKVEAELANLERRKNEKLANEIPPELLPAKE